MPWLLALKQCIKILGKFLRTLDNREHHEHMLGYVIGSDSRAMKYEHLNHSWHQDVKPILKIPPLGKLPAAFHAEHCHDKKNIF